MSAHPLVACNDELVAQLRSHADAYPEDIFTPLSNAEVAMHEGIVTRASASMGRHMGAFLKQAADRIEELERGISDSVSKDTFNETERARLDAIGDLRIVRSQLVATTGRIVGYEEETKAARAYAEQLQRTATAFLKRAVLCRKVEDFDRLMDSDELFDLRGSLSKTPNPSGDARGASVANDAAVPSALVASTGPVGLGPFDTTTASSGDATKALELYLSGFRAIRATATGPAFGIEVARKRLEKIAEIAAAALAKQFHSSFPDTRKP